MIGRACAACGQPITVTTRNPNRRYCSPRCRVADWHARNDRVRSVHAVRNDVNAVTPVGNVVPPETNAVAPAPNAVPTANGVQRCPHCHGELAVIAVVVPPAAAHIRTPEVTHMNPI
jgi:endogenous inhibitor of DNA gyrase (YacG/DUF329 family)